MEANDVLAVVGMLEEYMPVVEKAVPLIARAGTEIKPLLESMTDTLVDLQIRSIKRYQEAGMSREEAILLSINAKFSLLEASKNMKKN